jgi:outer membrane protein assembly factor BamD
MRKVHALILLAAGACLIPGYRAGAAIDYTPGTGWTTEDASGQDAAEATASAQLLKAEALEKAGNYHRAAVAYYTLTRKFPRSGAAAQAQVKAADMAFAGGDYDHAYALYSEYLSKYPKGEQFDEALEGMYNIGQKFLEGARRELFGVKTFPSMARAQQIFENIVKTAPFSKWAPLAEFYAGQALEKQGQQDSAIADYNEVISRYPTDPAAADAQYQIGYVYLVQSRTAYDNAAAEKAQEAFEDFLARYPTSEKAPQAQDNIKALQTHENSGAIQIAKFYDKKKNYKAAVIYYNEVIQEQPGTDEAKAAQARIDALKAKVGDAALEPGPEQTQTGAKAVEERRLQAQVQTTTRPDYVGPPVAEPTPVPTPTPDETPAPAGDLRTSPDDMNLPPSQPPVEPPLPGQ